MTSRRPQIGLLMASERSYFKIFFFASWVSKYRFFGSRFSIIALVLVYDFFEATSWPQTDLWEGKIRKSQFLFMGFEIELFFGVRDFKNNISFGF